MTGTNRFGVKPKYQDNHKLIIPGELPTLNDIIEHANRSKYEYNEVKKSETNKVAIIAKASDIPSLDSIKVKIIYYTPNKRKDPDNIVSGGKKMIMDGLVKGGIIKNDGWKQIKGFEESWEVDKDEPRIEVILKESD